MPVEVDHLAVVPAPVPLLDVGQVEARRPQPLFVARINLFLKKIMFSFVVLIFENFLLSYILHSHLGNAAVVGGGVQEICRAVGGIVVIPWRRKIRIILKLLKTPHMNHVRHERS